jgi:hypothetical protein
MVVTPEPASIASAFKLMAVEICSKMQQRQADDTGRKLQVLYTKLGQGQMREEMCVMLAGLCNALATNNQPGAELNQRNLAQAAYDAGEDVTSWLVGTQRLVQFCFRETGGASSSASSSSQAPRPAEQAQSEERQQVQPPALYSVVQSGMHPLQLPNAGGVHIGAGMSSSPSTPRASVGPSTPRAAVAPTTPRTLAMSAGAVIVVLVPVSGSPLCCVPLAFRAYACAIHTGYAVLYADSANHIHLKSVIGSTSRWVCTFCDNLLIFVL